jgi:uncharacterized protein with PIN domain
MEPKEDKAQSPLFLADSTLGGLAKWLRLAGLDTRLDMLPPDPERLRQMCGDEHRWVLTRARRVYHKLGPNRCLFIRSNAPIEQVRQVIRDLKIQRPSLRPLSRCTRCNQLICPVSKESIIGRIPDYVWQKYDRFTACTKCRCIFWPGTHASRINLQIDRWFP